MMEPLRQSPPRPVRHFRIWVISAAWLLGTQLSPLFAADPLRMVPKNVAGVLTFSNLKRTNDQLGRFIQGLQPDYDGYDPDEFEVRMGLNPGTIDTTRPIHVIFPRPESVTAYLVSESLIDARGPYPIIAFHPAPASDLSHPPDNTKNRVRRHQGPFGPCYRMIREDVVFICNKKKPLWDIRQVTPDRSLAATLDEDVKATIASGDLTVHLPLERWRERIRTYTLLATNYIRYYVTAQQDLEQLEQTQAVMDWLINGVREAIDQMTSLTFALSFDGETLRVDHHHAFAPGGWMAKYLNDIKRSDEDLWSAFPDQPFLLIGAMDWRCPARNSFTCRMISRLLDTKSIQQSMPSDQRGKLMDCMRSFIDEIQSYQFMFTSPPGRCRPFSVLELCVAEDAADLLKNVIFVQEQSLELVAGFMPGCGPLGSKFEEKARDGIKWMEMNPITENTSEDLRRMCALLYGDDMRIQQAVVGKHRFVATTGAPPCSVTCMTDTLRSGKNIGRNPRIDRIRGRLQAQPNIIVIGDAGRMISAIRPLQRAALAAAGTPTPVRSTRPEDAGTFGPLFGWSCRVRPNAIHGRWAMDKADLAEVIHLSKQFFRQVVASGDPDEPPADEPPSKEEIESENDEIESD